MANLGKFLRLPSAERRLLKTALLLEAIKLGLRLLPFKALRRLLAKVKAPAGAPPQASDTRPSAKEVVRAVEVANRYTPGSKTCLVQALAAQVLLTRQGYPAFLHIGVLKDEGGRLQAHAWVESGGEVVIGGSADLEHFIPLPALEGDRP